MRREHYQPQGGILPSGYAQLNYIQSTGTQWIDTGLVMATGMRIIMDVTTTDISGGILIGKMDSSAVKRMYIGFDVSHLAVNYANTNVGRYNSNLSINNNQRYTFESWLFSNNVKQYIDGVEKFSDTSKSWTPESNTTVPIFCRRIGTSTIGAQSKCKLHESKLYSNTTDASIVAHYIPALRIAYSKPGLYDLVNNQFYTNAGTGEFLYN